MEMQTHFNMTMIIYSTFSKTAQSLSCFGINLKNINRADTEQNEV